MGVMRKVARQHPWPLVINYSLGNIFIGRVNGISFWRNCGAASVGEWYTKIRFINGVDNVNWPPYRDWKADVSFRFLRAKDEGLTPQRSAFQSLYGGQFTLGHPILYLQPPYWGSFHFTPSEKWTFYPPKKGRSKCRHTNPFGVS